MATPSELSVEDRYTMFGLLGEKCISLMTSMAQLLLSEERQHYSQWQIQCTGIVCLVKDHNKRSFFIRVFNLHSREMVWEQNIKNISDYRRPRTHFITFKADDCTTGLKFTTECDAKVFENCICMTLNKPIVNKQAPPKPGAYTRIQTHVKHSVPVPLDPTHRSQSLISLKSYKSNESKVKPKKIYKEDIGKPTNFQHIQHIGWSPKTGFKLENVQPNYCQFLEESGLINTNEPLEDSETRTLVEDFIEKQGGIQPALQVVKRTVPFIASLPSIAALKLQSDQPLAPPSNHLPHTNQFEFPPPPNTPPTPMPTAVHLQLPSLEPLNTPPPPRLSPSESTLHPGVKIPDVDYDINAEAEERELNSEEGVEGAINERNDDNFSTICCVENHDEIQALPVSPTPQPPPVHPRTTKPKSTLINNAPEQHGSDNRDDRYNKESDGEEWYEWLDSVVLQNE